MNWIIELIKSSFNDARKVVAEGKNVVKFMNCGSLESYERLDVHAFEVVNATFRDFDILRQFMPSGGNDPLSTVQGVGTLEAGVASRVEEFLRPEARSTSRCRLESSLKPESLNQPLSFSLRFSVVCSLVLSPVFPCVFLVSLGCEGERLLSQESRAPAR